MENQLYFVYSKKSIILEDLTYIQKLYLPIIGPIATVFYHTLTNIIKNHQNNKITSVNTIKNLIKSMNIDEDLFLNTRKLLEAIGLIKTFISNDQKKITFEMLKPLEPSKFFTNKLLKNLLLRQIGEIELDSLMHFYKKPIVDMDDYINISANFTDLFDLKELVKKDMNLTKELELPVFNSNDEALENLTSSMYYKYKMDRYPNTHQLEKLTRFLESGLSNASLNLLLNHSYKKNGAIIFNYIETIILDLKSRGINSFYKIKAELSQSIKPKFEDNLNLTSHNSHKDRSVDDMIKEMFPN